MAEFPNITKALALLVLFLAWWATLFSIGCSIGFIIGSHYGLTEAERMSNLPLVAMLAAVWAPAFTNTTWKRRK